MKTKVQYILLFVLSLIVYCVFGALVIKIFDVLLKMEMENVWGTGFKVGFIAWLIVMIVPYFVRKKK